MAPESQFPTCGSDRDVLHLAEYKVTEAQAKSGPAIPKLNSSLALHEARATLLAQETDESSLIHLLELKYWRPEMRSSLAPTEVLHEEENIRQNRRPEIIVSSTICIALATTAVALRLLARRTAKVQIKADDYMMVLALISCMGQVATSLYLAHLGAGKHVILLKNPPAFAKTIISTEVLYCIGTAAFKFSALLLFHRIFGLARRFTILLWVVAFVIAANNIAEIFLSIFQCTPVHKAWDQHVAGSCVNILLAACIPGAINVLTDFAIVLLPIPMVWSLQMGRSRKIQLVAVFFLSGFVCIASTYRTIVVKRLSHFDASWADVDPIIWAVVENAIGIVSASLPTMRPIYNLLVHGHHCNSGDLYCSRCVQKSSKSNPGSGGTHEMGRQTKLKGKGSTSTNESSVELAGREKGEVVPEAEV